MSSPDETVYGVIRWELLTERQLLDLVANAAEELRKRIKARMGPSPGDTGEG